MTLFHSSGVACGVALVLLGSVAACASSPAMRAAQRGDAIALGSAIAARETAGNLSTREAAALAKVVAGRELQAGPPPEAVDRVQDVRACAHELDDALARRMRTHDAAGAAAALVRVDQRALEAGDVRRFVTDPDAHWRALGARGLVRPDDRAARLEGFVDADPAVRRQAVRASRDASDPRDLDALFEVARVDPEPIVRTEAVRAIAHIPAADGNAVSNALRDLWTVGDDAIREDIVRAWSGPSLWATGGRDALRLIVGSDHGPGAIQAAAAVLETLGADAEAKEAAAGLIAESIQAGPRSTRLQAIAQAPLDRHAWIAILRVAAQDDDLPVRIAALGRLAEGGDVEARSELEAMAAGRSTATKGSRLVLAMAGDRRVQGWIEQGLSARKGDDRLDAAVALAALGVPARAAPLLADASARVRVRAACTILVAARVAR
jgi:hypothetical protein